MLADSAATRRTMMFCMVIFEAITSGIEVGLDKRRAASRDISVS